MFSSSSAMNSRRPELLHSENQLFDFPSKSIKPPNKNLEQTSARVAIRALRLGLFSLAPFALSE
jgi:hypothetical protein